MRRRAAIRRANRTNRRTESDIEAQGIPVAQFVQAQPHQHPVKNTVKSEIFHIVLKIYDRMMF